jgi:hypothetical protein
MPPGDRSLLLSLQLTINSDVALARSEPELAAWADRVECGGFIHFKKGFSSGAFSVANQAAVRSIILLVGHVDSSRLLA